MAGEHTFGGDVDVVTGGAVQARAALHDGAAQPRLHGLLVASLDVVHEGLDDPPGPHRWEEVPDADGVGVGVLSSTRSSHTLTKRIWSAAAVTPHPHADGEVWSLCRR